MSVSLPKVYGFNPNSEAGEDCTAASIFMYGCNMRCPFCMNYRLVLGGLKKPKVVSLDKVKKHVFENDTPMVIISGGEPCLLKDLAELVEEIRSWPCEVGICTNGTCFTTLSEVLPMINFVAVDVKASTEEEYAEIDKVHEKWGFVLLKESLTDIRAAAKKRDNFTYELRTTMYRPFINPDNVSQFASVVRREDRWVLQHFRNNIPLLEKDAYKVEPLSEEEVAMVVQSAHNFCSNVGERYV